LAKLVNPIINNYQDIESITFILKMFFTLFTKLMKVDDDATECSKILS
jgi:hypothetical protein